jgi:hypothetical protein
VDFEEGNVPVVRARGLIFPMLVQELAKGLLELVSYEGLPSDPKMAKEVIDKSDFVDQESWAMIMGRGLWTRFVNSLGGDETEITMHLYNRLVRAGNHCVEAWADVDAELRRRYDLIPNLVNVVKGYAAHERELLQKVAALREECVANTGSPATQADSA